MKIIALDETNSNWADYLGRSLTLYNTINNGTTEAAWLSQDGNLHILSFEVKDSKAHFEVCGFPTHSNETCHYLKIIINRSPNTLFHNLFDTLHFVDSSELSQEAQNVLPITEERNKQLLMKNNSSQMSG